MERTNWDNAQTGRFKLKAAFGFLRNYIEPMWSMDHGHDQSSCEIVLPPVVQPPNSPKMAPAVEQLCLRRVSALVT